MSKKEKNCPPCRKTSIGGQALLEGVMMRGPERYALSVRRPNGEIYFETHENVKKKRPAICRWPLIRGVFGFIDSLTLGYKCLMRSAEISTEEEEPIKKEPCDAAEPVVEAEKETAETKTETVEAEAETAKTERPAGQNSEPPKPGIGKGAMAAVTIIATVLGFALAIGLFVWLPTFLFSKKSN